MWHLNVNALTHVQSEKIKKDFHQKKKKIKRNELLIEIRSAIDLRESSGSSYATRIETSSSQPN